MNSLPKFDSDRLIWLTPGVTPGEAGDANHLIMFLTHHFSIHTMDLEDHTMDLEDLEEIVLLNIVAEL